MIAFFWFNPINLLLFIAICFLSLIVWSFSEDITKKH